MKLIFAFSLLLLVSCGTQNLEKKIHASFVKEKKLSVKKKGESVQFKLVDQSSKTVNISLTKKDGKEIGFSTVKEQTDSLEILQLDPADYIVSIVTKEATKVYKLSVTATEAVVKELYTAY